MRSDVLLLLSRLAGTSAIVAVAACGTLPDDCHQTLTCPTSSSASTSTMSVGGATSTGTEGGGGSSSNVGGGGGSSTSTMTNCDPTLGAVDGSCGIFVSSSMGHDTDEGSEAKPVRTLARAINLAATNGSRIYACGEEFDEAITLPAGTSLYGALDCTHGWAYAASATTSIVAPADQIAMTLPPGAATSAVSDVSIAAVDATAAGGSSIAVFANAATATLERCTLAAGVGAAGTPGAAQQEVVTPAMADGLGGSAGCTSSADVPGGAHGNNACGVVVGGGSGGSGTNTVGTTGGDGSPVNTGSPPADGKGGHGDVGVGCASGDDGAPGPDGSFGSGAAALGALSASGYAAALASDGASPGTPGQGGGGGGGAGLCGAANAGPSGGGGGAGGCGGAAGKAGTSGGSSIGLASFDAHVTLKDSTITVAHAGDGGLGGDGQKGGFGGNSGDRGGAGACGGGAGGKGGNGGPGGGGAGGNSLGIAFHGGAAPIVMTTMITTDVFGAGALGGNANTMAQGADGLACKTVDLGDGSSCMP